MGVSGNAGVVALKRGSIFASVREDYNILSTDRVRMRQKGHTLTDRDS
jgi:hypothetical protein